VCAEEEDTIAWSLLQPSRARTERWSTRSHAALQPLERHEFLWSSETIWSQSWVTGAKGAHRACIPRRWTWQAKPRSHLWSVQLMRRQLQNAASRNLNTAINIIRRWTTELQEKKRSSHWKSTIR